VSSARPAPTPAPPNHQPTTLPPSRPRVSGTSRAPESSEAMSPTLFPRPPRAVAQRPPPAKGKAVTALPRNGRGTADGGPRGQQVRKRRPPQPARLGYSTQTPNGMGNRTGSRRAQHPGIYTVWRAQRPAVSPPPVPLEARRHKAPTPVGAYPTPARPLAPLGCPEAACARSLALRLASAILGRSRPFAPRAPLPRLARKCQRSPRAPLQAPAKGLTPSSPFARLYETR